MGWDTRNYWTYAQISLLWELARNQAPLLEISSLIGKPDAEICVKAKELGIPLSSCFWSTRDSAYAKQARRT